MGVNNIEFTTGAITSNEGISLQINGNEKFVIRGSEVDACRNKIINVALPAAANDACNKGYVDHAVKQV